MAASSETEKKTFGPRLYKWQKLVMDKFLNQTDNRTILFVVDRTGGRGKTFLAQYMWNLLAPGTHVTVTSAKTRRSNASAMAKLPDLETVAFDYDKSIIPETFEWGLFVGLKDSVIVSKRKMLYFKDSVKVAVFTNHSLSGETYRLSEDRVNIVDLDEMFETHGQSMFDKE